MARQDRHADEAPDPVLRHRGSGGVQQIARPRDLVQPARPAAQGNAADQALADGQGAVDLSQDV
jgi:hypothetical protein